MMQFNPAADLQPIHDGHRVIDDCYIRLHLQSQRNGFLAIGRLPAHGPVGASFDDRAKTGANGEE